MPVKQLIHVAQEVDGDAYTGDHQPNYEQGEYDGPPVVTLVAMIR